MIADPRGSEDQTVRVQREAELVPGSLWTEVLSDLERRYGIAPDFADHIRAVWASLSSAVHGELPVPMAEPTADGERFQLAWSYRALLLEVEVDPHGLLTWFATDRNTWHSASSESPPGPLGRELVTWLHRVVGA